MSWLVDLFQPKKEMYKPIEARLAVKNHKLYPPHPLRHIYELKLQAVCVTTFARNDLTVFHLHSACACPGWSDDSVLMLKLDKSMEVHPALFHIYVLDKP